MSEPTASEPTAADATMAAGAPPAQGKSADTSVAVQGKSTAAILGTAADAVAFGYHGQAP